MPHIIIEHTRDVKNIEPLIREAHEALASQETVTMGAIKTRAIPLDHVVVGDGNSQSMVHAEIKLLPGRSDDLKNTMTAVVESVIKNNVSQQTSVTVEATELHKESYRN